MSARSALRARSRFQILGFEFGICLEFGIWNFRPPAGLRSAGLRPAAAS